MALIDVSVAEIVDEAPDVKSFRLVRSDGSPMGTYLPGAHIDVVGPTAITRQYSLCSTPDAEDAFTVAVKREEHSRGGSTALHALAVGDRLRISEPRNLLGIDPSATHHVLIAAGIGITPLLSMARYLHVHAIGFELHYFARSSEHAAFLPLLRERCPDKLAMHLGVPRAAQDELLDRIVAHAPAGSHVYTCGPGGFMDKVIAVAGTRLPESAIHLEQFQAVATDDTDNRAFEVELEGEVYRVPADRSIVEVLQEHGCDVDTSCQEGICGTCIMTVLSGRAEHRDAVLTRAEREAGETMAVCVSRTRDARIVLDYY